MKFPILVAFIYLLSLITQINTYLSITGVCPDGSSPVSGCSDEIDCENGALCYRDVPFYYNQTDEEYFGCCEHRCPTTKVPYGSNYEDQSQSMISTCTNLLPEHFYLDLKPNSKNKTGCCPLPISDFVFGKECGLIVNDTYALPKGWKLDKTTSEISGLKKCCNINDCGTDSYCGAVRNPGSLNLVEKSEQNCAKKKRYDNIDIYMRFCYLFPISINLTSIGISQRDQDSNLVNLQLCKTDNDCWSTKFFCKLSENSDEKIGVCRPVLGNLVEVFGAKDAFLVPNAHGCSSNEQCDQLGEKWFSYRCEDPGRTKICVGYEMLCSKSALHEHSLGFGCQTDQDCAENDPKDGVHVPKCAKNPFVKGGMENGCCYEMNSCQFHLDITPYGLSPLNKSTCFSDQDCHELADHMMKNQPSGRRDVFWGRCMEELENNVGKCCIADVSTLCSVGKSIFPPRTCSNHSECGFNPTVTKGANPWCGDEGYCCEDHENEKSWMCPDGKSIRVEQEKCDERDGDWCNGQAGHCLLGRCCPMVKPSDNYKIHVWAETPWYYSNLTCNDTSDLPESMDMIYCDPYRNTVTRMTRNDKWWSPILAAANVYCEKNEDCTKYSSSLVCVKEQKDLQRCYTYYDRNPHWYLFIIPVIISVLTVIMVWKILWDDVKILAESQWEVLR
ncbi:hypothetical protein B9Z55_027184 [Caenorhabditis nigoni]|uniref:Domain of unknown function DX domain-containing protein n=1 Tax=Caenorhabditis nigoni TaxID=1611254 RepID=A0A2G5SH50_9PELO|nr:hypothetical protein B9Z55_027184 [Caenorhabditis nigoni]